jgi:ABC-2 type transport system ATP-binding protein
MTENAIAANNISKSYGNFQAVDSLTFDIFAGEVFALLGPNGAGKSTTIRMFLDIIKPDSGKINVLGSDKLSDTIKDRIGYLPEERGLYRSVPVLDMMVYLGMLKGLSRNDAKQESMRLLEKLELGENAKSKVSELSKGMQQKVQFAVTVMHNPDLIIIDEPFSGLDPVNRLVIKDLLLEFKDRGGAIVMSTHQMNQVEEMADRMLMISQGKRKLYGNVDEIRQQYAQHAIIVEGEGDWTTLDGVSRIEIPENGRKGIFLHLHENATADGVLAAIANDPNLRIERFERAIPSLDEIFIRVAGEEKNKAHG